MNRRNKFLKRAVSIVLTLCMIISGFTVMDVQVQAAAPRYYTVEKYDAEGNGTILVPPTMTESWSGSYGTPFITSLLGSDQVKMSNDEITGFKDDSREDGWLDNGDLGEGSKWVISADGECYTDSASFWASRVTVLRIIYIPGSDLEKAGITSEGAGWGTVGNIKVSKDALIQTLSQYDANALGGNRRAAYDEAVAMLLNTTDATPETVAAAKEKMETATDGAVDITLPEEKMEIYGGQKVTVIPTLDPLGSTDVLTWESTDETVATVKDGVIKGIGAGTATITVTAENPEVKDSVEVTVRDVDSLYITNMGSTNQVEAISGELNLMAEVVPSGIENLDWEWSVEDETVAEVIPMEGNEYLASVKGKKEGKTSVIVKVGSKTSTFEVEVTAYQGPYVYFEYEDGRDPQILGEDNTITLTCLDEGKFVVGRSEGTTTWSGGSDFVSSIAGGDDLQYWSFINRETGKWNPWDTRTLNIIADSGGWSKSFQVTCVSSGITELKTCVGDQEVSLDQPYVTEGTTSGVEVTTYGRKTAEDEWQVIPAQALHYDTNDTTYNFRWVGNNLSIKTGGQAAMSVFMKDNWSVKQQFLAKCNYQPLSGFQITTPETFTITGETDFMTGYYYGLQLYSDNLKIDYTPSNATNKELIWEALTPDVAFYSSQHNSGIVPKRAGVAKFKVTSQDNPSLTQEVTVTFVYQVPLTDASLKQTSYEMNVGDTLALSLETTPSNATNSDFDWSYSENGIVSMNGKTIVAKKAGTVTVTGTPYDTSGGCKPITFTVTVKSETAETYDPMPTVKAGITHGLDYLERQSVTKYGDEWNIFTILRAGGTIQEADQSAYLDSVETSLKNGLNQPTDYVRVVLTLGVMGENPENFRGMNLLEKLYNWKDLDELTSNQISWTLIALDSKNYKTPAKAKWNRDSLIEMLLLFQDASGGFTLTDATDVDMTGMILQALAPYNNEKHPEVQEAFEKALTWLQEQMSLEAGFAANKSYNENSCTTAQILTALSVAGMDAADGKNGFTIGQKNMITNLWSYKAEEGFYWDPSVETKGNAMGTQQTTYAFEAYRRFVEKENALYDLTDVGGSADDNQEAEKEAAEKAALEKLKTEFRELVPSAAAKAVSYNCVELSWKSCIGAASYSIYRKVSGGNWQKLGETKELNFRDRNAVTGTRYYYAVQAVSTAWGETVYSQLSNSVTAKTVPAKAVISVKNKKGKKALITWKKVAGASGYIVYRASKKNGTYKAIKTIRSGKTVKYTDSKRKKGSTCYYKVRAYRKVNGKKVYSAYSSAKAVKIKK